MLTMRGVANKENGGKSGASQGYKGERLDNKPSKISEACGEGGGTEGEKRQESQRL